MNDPLRYPNFFLELRYPILLSPKHDGIRSIIKNKQCMSRTFKPLPSYQAQDEFRMYEHMDGELIEGNHLDPDVYNRTQSYIMSGDKFGELTFNVFDYTHPDWLRKPFYQRLERLEELVRFHDDEKLIFVEHELVENEDELLAYEERILDLGWEGVMGADPMGYYKQGRATWKEQLRIKLKRFTDSEGQVVGIVEATKNENIQVYNELGYAKRSKKRDALEPNGMLGRFIVLFEGQEINVAPGVYKHEQRRAIFENPDCNPYINLGDTLKFRHFAHGQKDAPRHARALGRRDPMDM
jgi:DNA ligase-1